MALLGADLWGRYGIVIIQGIGRLAKRERERERGLLKTSPVHLHVLRVDDRCAAACPAEF